jgi:hypothetical protein
LSGQQDAGVGRRWFALDQGLSSATNFASAALVAGLLSNLDFGGWAIAYATFVVILSTIRTWAGDAALIVAPAAEPMVVRSLVGGAATVAVASGAAAGALLAAGAFAVGGATRLALLALAVCLPALMLQDCLRLCLLAVNRPRLACANDGLWLAGSVAALMILRLTDRDSVMLAMLAWAGPAGPCALLALRQAHARVSIAAARHWVRSIRAIVPSLLGAHTCYLIASMTMVSVVVGLVGNARSAGSIRAAQTLYGPVTVALAARALYTQPVVVRRLAAGQAVLGQARHVSLSGAALTVLCAVVLWGTPTSIGKRVFGHSWDGAHSLVPAMGLVIFVSALMSGAAVALRASRNVTTLLRVNLIAALVLVPTTWWWADRGSPRGALASYAILSGGSAVALWMSASRALRRTQPASFTLVGSGPDLAS